MIFRPQLDEDAIVKPLYDFINANQSVTLPPNSSVYSNNQSPVGYPNPSQPPASNVQQQHAQAPWNQPQPQHVNMYDAIGQFAKTSEEQAYNSNCSLLRRHSNKYDC